MLPTKRLSTTTIVGGRQGVCSGTGSRCRGRAVGTSRKVSPLPLRLTVEGEESPSKETQAYFQNFIGQDFAQLCSKNMTEDKITSFPFKKSSLIAISRPAICRIKVPIVVPKSHRLQRMYKCRIKKY